MSRIEVVEYDPLPTFDPFHQYAGREGLIAGGYGSGKSVALCAELLKQALKQPGSEWLLTRMVASSLAITTEKTFLDMLPPGFASECNFHRGGGHVLYIDLPNASRIHFRGLDDWRKVKSIDFAGFFADEVDEIPWDTYVNLKSRVRQVHPLGHQPGIIQSGIIRLAMNPNGHDPYWDYFIKDKPRHGRILGGGDVMAFLSTSLDNPYLPNTYIEDMLNMPEPWVRRYVFCSFDNFQGVIYPEWSWETHTVEPYGYYTPSGLFLMGMDPGTANPTAAMWCYHDREQELLVGVAEYLESGVAVTPHVHAWRNIEGHGTHNLTRSPGRMTVHRRIADPSIAMRDRGSMMALESQYRRHGFVFEHGPKNIPDRMPALGELIHRGKFVVTKEMEQTFEQIKNYRYEDLTPDQIAKGVEAKPFKKNVDIVDAAQYIASRWIAPGPARPVPVTRPKQRVTSPAEMELLLRIKSLREAGLKQEARLLEQELIPDGVLEDARRGIVRRSRKRRQSDKTVGLT